MNAGSQVPSHSQSTPDDIYTPLDCAVRELRRKRDAIYTPLEDAVEELQDRRRKFAGRTPGREWLSDQLTTHPFGCAIFPRDVATPNFELRSFLKSVDVTNLRTVIVGFSQCKFVTHNPLKHALARMGFLNGFNRHGHPLVEFVNILDHGCPAN